MAPPVSALNGTKRAKWKWHRNKVEPGTGMGWAREGQAHSAPIRKLIFFEITN
jgi:hypothetical protein